MRKRDKIVYPYIPNSVSEVKEEMLREIGVENIEELYADIPNDLVFRGEMKLPKPLLSEYALKRHIQNIISKNWACEENISFLGGGCWQHYVPAVCDEINQRAEFLTAYAGEPYEDHGRWQALFEFQSLLAELVDMDVVSVPTYSWAQAAGTSIRMASRITGRDEILISDTISPDRLLVIRNYCSPDIHIKMIGHSHRTGLIDIEDLKSKISSETAGVYFENPSYLGFIESRGDVISDIIHEKRALTIVGVDPISLGVIAPPSNYGADIVCGDIQPLGIHMNYGGGLGGFIATHDEKKFVMEIPYRLFGITRTSVEGEYGFGDVAFERTSFAGREEGKEFVGTAAALWGITAAVYLSLIGPRGIWELGKTIMQRSQYTMKKLSGIDGVIAPYFKAAHFKEFVVDFNRTGISVKKINRCLLKHRIFGGIDLSKHFPELEESALYSVTEIHMKNDIDKLIEALKKCICDGGDDDES